MRVVDISASAAFVYMHHYFALTRCCSLSECICSFSIIFRILYSVNVCGQNQHHLQTSTEMMIICSFKEALIWSPHLTSCLFARSQGNTADFI